MTLVIPGALSPVDVSTFLTARLTALYVAQSLTLDIPKYSYDDDIPPAPDRLYTIIGPNSGPGFNTEGVYDSLAFQLRTRGKQGGGVVGKLAASEDARILAWQADRALLEAVTPCAVGSQHVNLITRVGSPPTVLMIEKSGRVTITCNYLFDVARY